MRTACAAICEVLLPISLGPNLSACGHMFQSLPSTWYAPRQLSQPNRQAANEKKNKPVSPRGRLTSSFGNNSREQRHHRHQQTTSGAQRSHACIHAWVRMTHLPTVGPYCLGPGPNPSASPSRLLDEERRVFVMLLSLWKPCTLRSFFFFGKYGVLYISFHPNCQNTIGNPGV